MPHSSLEPQPQYTAHLARATRQALSAGRRRFAGLVGGDPPSVGADYVEEALLSATFVARYAPYLTEIVIVTDQSAAAFLALPAKTRGATQQ